MKFLILADGTLISSGHTLKRIKTLLITYRNMD
nr:MAG TPA: hypothetical protein [Bacteriophage sp.]